ncbi:MAG: c-type cytochrome domain-containing protein [Verrucomicrobiales bacterium]
MKTPTVYAPRMRYYLVAIPTLLAMAFSGCTSLDGDLPVGDEVDFVQHIKPILEERCIQCHNAGSMPGRLSFESREQAFATGKHGRAIVPGDPDSSRMVSFINAPRDSAEAMPRAGHQISAEEAETIREWIAAGAKWPTGEPGHVHPGG